MSMMNRRNMLQSGICLPFLHPFNLKRRKRFVEKVADEIEQKAIECLSAKNPVLQTIKNVKIFEDLTRYKFGHSAFYGWVEINLYPINPHIYMDSNIDTSKSVYSNITDLVNNFRSADYGFCYDLDFLLSEEDTKKVLDILWKRAGFKGYNK